MREMRNLLKLVQRRSQRTTNLYEIKEYWNEFTNGSKTGFFYRSGWVGKSIQLLPGRTDLYVYRCGRQNNAFLSQPPHPNLQNL